MRTGLSFALWAGVLVTPMSIRCQPPCPAPALPQVCSALIPGTPLPYTNSAAPTTLDLQGATTVEVRIFGHSENRGYHTFLQSMLDAAPPLAGVDFQVTNHWIAGHEAYRWATPGQRGYNAIQAALQARRDPMIALGLFSNNASFPIGTPALSDPNYVKFVADLEAIGDLLHDNGNGAHTVYISAHRYKPSNFLPSYYESCAIGRLMAVVENKGKGHVKAGPEQHDLHWCCFPTCYDPDRAHTNPQGDQLMAQTWYAFLVRELTGCASVPYGSGLAGTGGATPVLGPSGGFPEIGNRQFGLSASDVRGGAQIAYLFGVAVLPGPILVQPDVVVGASASGAGTHLLPLPIPPNPSLHGGVLRTQVIALDSGAAAGFATSQGLELHLCQ